MNITSKWQKAIKAMLLKITFLWSTYVAFICSPFKNSFLNCLSFFLAHTMSVWNNWMHFDKINVKKKVFNCFHLFYYWLYRQGLFSLQIPSPYSFVWFFAAELNVTSLSLKNQNQEWMGLTMSTLSTIAEQKLILAVADSPVIYDLTLKGYHYKYLK